MKDNNKDNNILGALAVLLFLLALGFLSGAFGEEEDSLAVFFSANEKYSENGAPNFSYNGARVQKMVGLLQTDQTAMGFIRGYATANEGYGKADFHRRLNNMSAGDYRASFIYDWLVGKYPDLDGRVHYLPAVVDSTVRGVRLWVKQSPSDSTAELLDGLEDKVNKHIADQAEINATNALLLKNIEDSLANVGNLKIPRLSLGVGATSVYYSQNNYVVVPTLLVEGELTNYFGWQATGGILPTGSEMFDGVAGLGLFVKPISFVKIYSGYLLESYFDKNFQWARDTDRTDAAMLSVGLEKSYKKVSGEISLGGFRDFRNGRWGAVNSLTITFNF